MSQGKTLDERLDALVQSVELLAGMHKDNEVRMARHDERMARNDERMARNDERMRRMHRAVLRAMEAYLNEMGENGRGEEPENN